MSRPHRLPTMLRPFASNRSRRWVWFALCVFTLSAWMPTLTSWVASTHARTNWTEICSASGARLLAVSMDQSSGDAGEAGHKLDGKGHCPFCLLQDHAPVLPATPASVAPFMPVTATLVPPLLLHAPRPLHAWSALAARGPPSAA